MACVMDNDVWRSVLQFHCSIVPCVMNPQWIGHSRVNDAQRGMRLGLVERLHRCDEPLFPYYKARVCIDRNWQNGNFTKRTIVGHSDSVYCLQFDELGYSTHSAQTNKHSQSNKHIGETLVVSGSRDKTVKFWTVDPSDSETFRPVRTLVGHEASVLCLQYNRNVNLPRTLTGPGLSSQARFDSRSGLDTTRGIVVTGSSDSTVKFWDFASSESSPIATLQAHASPILDIRVDEQKLITASKDCSIRVWSLPSSDENATLGPDVSLLHTLDGHAAAVNAIQFRENALVSASGDCTLRVWDLKSAQTVRTCRGHVRGLASLHFAPPLMVTGSNDKTIRVWDMRVSERSGCVGMFSGHDNLVRTVDMGARYSSGVWRIVSGSYDESIRVWDQRCMSTGGKTGLVRAIEAAHESWVFGVACNATKIVSSSQVCAFVGLLTLLGQDCCNLGLFQRI